MKAAQQYNFRFIDNYLALSQLCREFKVCSWLAIDTEFERSNTYYPELCLLQVASNNITVVIDPLVIADLEPLYEVLYDPGITKVFHSARQDLEIFFHIRGEVPMPLFDTQIAASFLDCGKQIGYSALIKEVLDIELPKTMTRTNWKQRPLSGGQLEYAADDVFYLGKIYELFIAELVGPLQISLLTEEFDSLTRPELYQPDPEDMWLKIKLARKLKGKSLNVLQQITAWREITARTENRPRNWILHDNTLIDIARLLPDNQNALSRIKGLNKQILELHGAAIVEIIGRVISKSV